MVVQNSADIPTGGTAWFETFLYRNRAAVIVVMLALLVFNVAYWAISNIRQLELGGPVQWWVEPAGIAAEIGLGLATTALAMAAFVQARAAYDLTDVGRAQIAVASRQADTADKLAAAAHLQTEAVRNQNFDRSRPGLTVEIHGSSVLLGQPSTFRPLAPGELITQASADSAFYVNNAGPGIAVAVEVEIVGVAPLSPSGSKQSRIPRARRTLPIIGPNRDSQIVLPWSVTERLWPSQSIGEGFCILAEVRTIASMREADDVEIDGLPTDDYEFMAVGGVIAEQVDRSDGKGIALAWSVVSDSEAWELIHGKIEPADLVKAHQAVGGRKRMRVDPPPLTSV